MIIGRGIYEKWGTEGATAVKAMMKLMDSTLTRVEAFGQQPSTSDPYHVPRAILIPKEILEQAFDEICFRLGISTLLSVGTLIFGCAQAILFGYFH
jgi:hypothetical protein